MLRTAAGRPARLPAGALPGVPPAGLRRISGGQVASRNPPYALNAQQGRPWGVQQSVRYRVGDPAR